jgi:hypothetical protein
MSTTQPAERSPSASSSPLRPPLGPPSSLEGVLGKQPFPSAPPAFVLRLVLWLRAKVVRLADRMVPAEIAVFDRSTGVALTVLLGAVARYGIADLLESEGPLSADELAKRSGTHPDTLHRVLRGLVTSGVFELRSDGRFANNRLSRAMVGGQLARTREWLQYFASASNVGSWCDLERTLASGGNGFERVFGKSVWDWFDAHPDEREMFAHSMMGLTTRDAPVVATVYPFREITTLCDVGGGRGTLLSELLIRHPHLKGVLCDAEGVLASARELLVARGVIDRVRLEPGNFFASVPSGADAYLLKNILHDWDDARCRDILRTVRKAMQPGQRVLLVESLLERNDTTNLAALADLQMMMVCSEGRERSAGELNQLLRDSGFAPARVFTYPTVSVVEGRVA